MRFLLFGLAWAMQSWALAEPQVYVGSEQCQSCHQQAYEQWQQSHHFRAMQKATEQTVLGDFNNRLFNHFGEQTRFYKKDKAFWVEADNSRGERQAFKVDYVFGFYPLQQYLLAFDDGRYQALSVAWDSRPKTEGGQRWYHLYPNEAVPAGDLLHWTGSYQNWNSRCASCHSTDLKRGYDAANNRYQTTWSEMNVACEACHGPAAKHLDVVNQQVANQQHAEPYAGFAFSLAQAGQWQPSVAATTAKRIGAPPSGEQVDTCAHCHARRSQMLEPPIPADFLQAHQTQFLADGLYYPDGQIRDEVYVYDAFKQSKMHAAGVVCSNCHQPHTGKLRVAGNGLCLQCHQADTFDTPTHHHHPASSAGAQCVNCHMPETVYMGVDPRRDHGLKIPRPDLSEQWQIPNACTQCHAGQSNAWAAEAVQQWYGSLAKHFNAAPVLAPAWQGNREALPDLMDLVQNQTVAPIVRASAVASLQRFHEPVSIAAAQAFLEHPDPMLRLAAAQALREVPEQQMRLFSLVEDPVKAVRMAVAAAISQAPQAQWSPAQQTKLAALYKEYEASLQVNADMPEAQLQLGAFYLSQQEIRRAGLAYQRAYQLAPTLPAVLINYADYYRSIGRDDRAKPLLQQALQQNPEQASLQHAMGLLLVRQQQLPVALVHLAKAVALAPSVSRYAYVYAVALAHHGELIKAVSVLEQALTLHPDDRAIASALVHYYPRLGRASEAEALRQQVLGTVRQ